MSAAPTPPTHKPRRFPAALELLLIVVMLAVLTAVHGASLRFGLFMDDLAHYRQLRDADWSLRGLTDACHLDLVGGTIELWWLPDTTLRFFRPVAFGLMKLAYTAVGWAPGPMHAVSLAWLAAAALLIGLILRRLGIGRFVAWSVAALFTIHPAHVATVEWIACQSELIVTTLLLAATVCFARARVWPGFAGSAHSRAWLAASVVLFALALGCRENAILWPIVMLAVEWLALRRHTWREYTPYLWLVGVIAAYLVVRSVLLGGAAVPPKPYVMPPGDPEFPRYVADKALYYLLGQFLFFPCVPIAGLPYLQSRPLLFYGASAAVLVFLAGVVVWALRRKARDGLPVIGVLSVAWLVVFMLPLLPVFESPHHLFLPGVGWALVWPLVLRTIAGTSVQPPRVLRLARVAVASLLTLAIGGVFARVATWLAWTLEAGQGIQDAMVAEIAAAPRPIRDNDTLYVANFPMVAHYLKLALEERLHVRGIRVVPLNWAPRLLGPATPIELTPIDDRTIEIEVGGGDRFFEGPLGRLIELATGRPAPDHADRRADLGLAVDVLDRDAAGIRRFRFTFSQPPVGNGLHLFWASRARWAYQMQLADLTPRPPE